jgi:hypothetical protein
MMSDANERPWNALGFHVVQQRYLKADFDKFETAYQAGNPGRGIRYLRREELFEQGRQMMVFLHNEVNHVIDTFARDHRTTAQARFLLSLGAGNPASSTRIGPRNYVVSVDADWMFKLHDRFLGMFSDDRVVRNLLPEIPVLTSAAASDKALRGRSLNEFLRDLLAWRAWNYAIDFIAIHEVVHFHNGHLDYLSAYGRSHEDEFGRLHGTPDDLILTRRALEYDADAVSFTNCLMIAQHYDVLFELGDMRFPMPYPWGQRLSYLSVVAALEILGEAAPRQETSSQVHFAPRRRISSLEHTGIGFQHQGMRKIPLDLSIKYAGEVVGPALALVYAHLQGPKDEAFGDLFKFERDDRELHTSLRRRWRRIQNVLNTLKLGPEIRLYDDVDPL